MRSRSMLLHPIEALARRRRLVALQRSDEMPFDVGQVGERGDFSAPFLHVVLAEDPLSQRVDRANRLGRKRLGNGRRGHVVGSRPAAWNASAMRAVTDCHALLVGS